MREVRIFISSPGDAQTERKRIERVIERLNGELDDDSRLQALRWEKSFYTADRSFQPQIPEACQCDIVIAVLRHRLGTPLPDEFPRMPNGERYPSGTAYEVLSAIEASKAKEFPDVYVFRYPDPPRVQLDDPASEDVKREWERVKSFFARWFETSEGHFKAAFHTFGSTEDLEEQAEALLQSWIESHLIKGRLPTWPIELMDTPFRGLAAFGARHAPVFFGRSRETRQAVELLKDAAERDTPFLLLLGPSGSGKSSLARAGLVPRLTAPGAVQAVDIWRVASMRPGEHADGPFAALAAQLLKSSEELEWEEQDRPSALPELADSDYSSVAALARLLALGDSMAIRPVLGALDRVADAERHAGGYDRPMNARLILLVDQLDELFATDVTAETREAFAQLLRAFAASGRVWVIATVRADFYEAYVSVAGLQELKTGGASLDVRPPGPAEMAEIVRAPAAAAHLVFETDETGRRLEDRILEDVERTDMLPLLQFTLSRLFEKRTKEGDEVRLTHAAYDEMGGLDGAIDEEAESALAPPLGDAEKAALPRLLRQLVTPAGSADGAGPVRMTARSVPWTEAVADEPSNRLVQALVDARILVSTSREEAAPSIRVAHERVLESWQRARKIVEDHADFFRIREDVERARARWDEYGRPADCLIDGKVLLAEAENIAARFPGELPEPTRAFITASVDLARRSQRRRERFITGTALLFAALFFGAAFLGLLAREAEREANRNIGIAADAADALVVDLANGLRDVKGVQLQTINNILDRAENVFASLFEAGADSPQMRHKQAMMHLEFHRTLESVGDPEGQRQRVGRAVETLEELVASHPDELDWQKDLADAYIERGDTRRTENDLVGALGEYEASLEIMQRLVATAPENREWLRQLALAHNKIGDVRRAEGDFEEAIHRYRTSIEIRESLAQGGLEETEVQRKLSVSYRKLGDVLRELNDHESALQNYRASRTIAEALAAANPDDLELQRNYYISQSAVAAGHLRQGSLEDAHEEYREVVISNQRLVELDPGNADWLRDLSLAHERVAQVLGMRGDTAEALETYRLSLEIRDRLAADEPENAQWQHDLAVAHLRFGGLLKQEGDLSGALRHFGRSVALMARLTVEDPDNPQWLLHYATGLVSVGDIRRQHNDLSGALEAYRRALATNRELADINPANVLWKRNLSLSHEMVGDVLLRRGDAEQALDAYGDSLAITRGLIDDYGRSPELNRDLFFNLVNMAMAERADGRRADAIRRFEAAEDIALILAEHPDASPQAQEELDWVREQIERLRASPQQE
ncbi:MAG: AAA family ATPase [Alphaproteobacteria bacterium]|jgi:tetratricopeptide (TPR) repeat protein/energy-coupling factor transporter ATP-binding protein EcfA2|nr:AAA family ATPase [Alphaproteobacteria bacterium]